VSAGQSDALRILVLGQTPPPFGGQAVMIQELLDGHYPGVELFHVRLDFSREMNEMGQWQFAKLLRLVRVVMETLVSRVRNKADVLYYPPSGPRYFPVVRDIAILCLTRWTFRQTIFHFHASGLSEFRPRLNKLFRWFYSRAFSKPDVAIHLAAAAPPEGAYLGATRQVIVPNGIQDTAGAMIDRSNRRAAGQRILFVGMMSEDKGILVTLRAFAKLRATGHGVTLRCVGRWASPEVEAEAKHIVESNAISQYVQFPGVLTGEDKWNEYREADIFCFPSFFHSETFPLVLLEAMCFSLPTVSTNWRGIPEVVIEGESALLVEPRDVEACADALAMLLTQKQLRLEMGRQARIRFEDLFTIGAHRKAMANVFHLVSELRQSA
jgi:glycosyltransferase involved in cell wall biosynthesis